MDKLDFKAKKFTGDILEKSEKTQELLSSVQAVPVSCDECSFCNSKKDMYMEMPVFGDWHSGSAVTRIGCVCKMSMQGYRDFNRTRFLGFEEVIEAWNHLQKEEVSPDSECSF